MFHSWSQIIFALFVRYSLIKFITLPTSTVEYAIRWIQVNQDGFKLNGTHQVLVNADYVNILEGSIHTLKEIAEALVVASKESGLKVKVDKN